MTVNELLEARAAEWGDKTLVYFKDEELSFRQLEERSRSVAHGLAKLGVEKGDKVCVLLPNCLEFLYSFFGIMRLGAVVVPINLLLKPGEIAYVVNHSDAIAIIICERFIERVVALKRECPKIKTVISSGGESDAVSFDTLLVSDDDAQLPPVAPDDQAAIVYTSGTTGKPKGAVLTHGNYFSDTDMIARSIPEIQASDKFLCILPLFHVNAQVVTTLLPIYKGASVLLLEGFAPRTLLPTLAESGATIFSAVATVYAFLNTVPDGDQCDLSSFRFCIAGGSPLPIEVAKEFQAKYGVRLIDGYGLTEGTCASCITPVAEGKTKAGCIGLPIKGQPMKVFDENDSEVPRNTVGEIVVQGPNVMKEYYKNPEATAETLRSGWLHTGDLGYMDEEGYVYIVDRKKEMIIRGGENVYPKEVEEVLYRHPAVLEAAVVGVPDDTWGEEIAAYIILKPDAKLTRREVVSYCKKNIAGYKCPRKVFFVDEFPKSPTGKVQKNKIVEEYVAKQDEGELASET